MNTELRVGQQVVRYDKDATLRFYEQHCALAGADECRCISCKNFAAQRESAFSGEFLSFLGQLGIDPHKEWEAFDYDSGVQNRDKRHQYGGWFVFCGRLTEGEKWRPEMNSPAFAHWFTTSFPTGGLPKDVDFCAVEFLVELPWAIAEAPDQPGLPKT